MTRTIIRPMLATLTLALFGAEPVLGQPPAFVPNYFNRQYQPISPYLRLFAPGPAVNWYYDVRPALDITSGRGRLNVPPTMMAPSRQTFFPEVDHSLSGIGDTPGENQQLMPATGHPSGFQNSMGFHPRLGGGATPAASTPAPSGASAPPAAALGVPQRPRY